MSLEQNKEKQAEQAEQQTTEEKNEPVSITMTTINMSPDELKKVIVEAIQEANKKTTKRYTSDKKSFWGQVGDYLKILILSAKDIREKRDSNGIDATTELTRSFLSLCIRIIGIFTFLISIGVFVLACYTFRVNWIAGLALFVIAGGTLIFSCVFRISAIELEETADREFIYCVASLVTAVAAAIIAGITIASCRN